MPQKKKTPIDRKKLVQTIILCTMGFVILLMSLSFINRITAKPTSNSPSTETTYFDLKQQTKVKVQILNACGIDGIAKKVKDYLVANGIDVTETGNYKGLIDKTILLVKDGESQSLDRISDLLGIDKSSILKETGGTNRTINSVIIGKDYNVLKAFNKVVVK